MVFGTTRMKVTYCRTGIPYRRSGSSPSRESSIVSGSVEQIAMLSGSPRNGIAVYKKAEARMSVTA